MPYISPDQRPDIDAHIDALLARIIEPGALNYTITRLCKGFIRARGKSYVAYNAVIGVLACVTHEFYRRDIAPYENEKCNTNGDVR